MFALAAADDVAEVRAATERLIAGLDPDAVPVPDALGVWAAFDAIERLGAAGKLLMARRVAEGDTWRQVGAPSAAHHLAGLAGTTLAEARAELDCSKRLPPLPATDAALRAGRLSREQAEAVADGATANPAQEETLLAVAERGSLRELRDTSLRVKAAADPDPEGTRRRQHAGRELRFGTAADGSWRVFGRATPEDGSRIESLLRPFVDAIFRNARAEGRREPLAAYRLDALLAALLVAGSAGDDPALATITLPKTRQPTHLAILRVDLEALVRGWVEGDETCDIPGVGPVSIPAARELLGNATLRLLITRGVDVLNVTHLGRGPTTAQHIALLWAQPGCTVLGCDHRIVPIDHRQPWVETHHTRLDELDPLCHTHHDRKTRDGWALVEGTGKRAFVPPDDPRHPRNPRPPPGTA